MYVRFQSGSMMLFTNHFHDSSFSDEGANSFISAVSLSRNASVVIWSKEKPMIANWCESNPSCARFARAGRSFRLVRSPLAPKITMTQGEAFCGATWECSGGIRFYQGE